MADRARSALEETKAKMQPGDLILLTFGHDSLNTGKDCQQHLYEVFKLTRRPWYQDAWRNNDMEHMTRHRLIGVIRVRLV